MRGVVSYACAGLSALCGAAATVVFFLAMFPARGNELLLHTTHWLLVAATGSGFVGLLAARALAARLVNALFALPAGCVLLIGAAIKADDERALAEAENRRIEREAPAPAGAPAETYDAATLLRVWNSARDATDERLGGKLVAITGLPGDAPSFDAVGARFKDVTGDATAHFYLSSAAPEGPVVCRYRGTARDNPTGEDQLHLEGCRAAGP
jgi:hypothetical protein